MSVLYAVIAVSSIAGVISIPAALISERTPVAAIGFGCAVLALVSQFTLVAINI